LMPVSVVPVLSMSTDEEDTAPASAFALVVVVRLASAGSFLPLFLPALYEGPSCVVSTLRSETRGPTC
jgi:hypothetical protein